MFVHGGSLSVGYYHYDYDCMRSNRLCVTFLPIIEQVTKLTEDIEQNDYCLSEFRGHKNLHWFVKNLHSMCCGIGRRKKKV